MTTRAGMRGRPLAALLLVLASWIGVRAASWDVAMLAPQPSPNATAQTIGDRATRPLAQAAASGGEARAFRPPQTFAPPVQWPKPRRSLGWPVQPSRATGPMPLSRSFVRSLGGSLQPVLAAPPGGRVQVRIAAAHSMMLMAVLQVTVPAGLSPTAAAAAEPRPVPLARDPAGVSRWSADGWLLLRRGGDALATAPSPATYGASQAGAVLRYRLAGPGGHRPLAYLRGTAALNGSGEREAALGLSARPLPRLPVAVLAELRGTQRPGGTRLRPAVMAVTELAPFDLAHRFRAEAYAQAGYVAGEGATGFADGQLRVDRAVASVGRAELRAGAGLWAGAQKRAGRLDLGPAASLGIGLGTRGSARVALDWRLRVAGEAAPSSGPALTLSAGF